MKRIANTGKISGCAHREELFLAGAIKSAELGGKILAGRRAAASTA